VTATDSAGAVATGKFALKVNGHKSAVPASFGDEVNAFGNGLDVYQQHYAPGAVISGWTATRGDPATLFIRILHGSNWQFEATRAGGAATGLCVTNPMGGWPDPAGPAGLLVVPCNNGPFQLFFVSGAHLDSVVNGMAVSPHGTGAQLTADGPAPWAGGSDYAWKDSAQLPG
jgi:hypothetical protein